MRCQLNYIHGGNELGKIATPPGCGIPPDACALFAGAMSASSSSVFLYGNTSMNKNSAGSHGGEQSVFFRHMAHAFHFTYAGQEQPLTG